MELLLSNKRRTSIAFKRVYLKSFKVGIKPAESLNLNGNYYGKL